MMQPLLLNVIKKVIMKQQNNFRKLTEKHIKGNSHKIKSKLQICSLLLFCYRKE